MGRLILRLFFEETDFRMTKFLSLPGACRRYSVCSRTIMRWIEADGFPRPVRIRNRRLFPLADIIAWERARR